MLTGLFWWWAILGPSLRETADTLVVARDFSSFSKWPPARRHDRGKFRPGPESLPRGKATLNGGKHLTGTLSAEGTVQPQEFPPKCRPNPPTKNRTRKPKSDVQNGDPQTRALRVGPFFSWHFSGAVPRPIFTLPSAQNSQNSPLSPGTAQLPIGPP